MKAMVSLAALVLLAACGGNGTPANGSADSVPKAQTVIKVDSEAAAPNKKEFAHENLPGYAMMQTLDCQTCHQPEKQVIGPSFMMIADRYDSTKKGTIDYLANKVIKGGTGNWGTAIMTAHDTISKAQAETLVRYILSYKQQK